MYGYSVLLDIARDILDHLRFDVRFTRVYRGAFRLLSLNEGMREAGIGDELPVITVCQGVFPDLKIRHGHLVVFLSL